MLLRNATNCFYRRSNIASIFWTHVAIASKCLFQIDNWQRPHSCNCLRRSLHKHIIRCERLKRRLNEVPTWHKNWTEVLVNRSVTKGEPTPHSPNTACSRGSYLLFRRIMPEFQDFARSGLVAGEPKPGYLSPAFDSVSCRILPDLAESPDLQDLVS